MKKYLLFGLFLTFGVSWADQKPMAASQSVAIASDQSSIPVYIGIPTPKFTYTMTLTPTMTSTGSATPTYTWTASYTPTATFTPTNTLPYGTNTFTPLATRTPTPTYTSTATYTPTGSLTLTLTFTNTLTLTNTPTPTFTVNQTTTPDYALRRLQEAQLTPENASANDAFIRQTTTQTPAVGIPTVQAGAVAAVAAATYQPTIGTGVQALNTPAYQNTPGGGYSSQTKQANESNTPTTNGSTHIDTGGVFGSVLVHLTPGWGAPFTSDSTGTMYANTDGTQYTYVASGTWTPSIQAAGLDLQIIGVANQRWHINHLFVRGDVTTAVLTELQLIKYSTAGTAGNIVGSVTPVAYDSNDPAPTILVKPYSTPATPGTVIATLWDNKLAFDAVGVVPTSFGDNFIDLISQCGGCKGVVLNAAAENIGIVAPSAMGSGTVLYFLAVMTRE